MASPTPWQLAGPKQPTFQRIERYARDLYNFPADSVSQGTNNPVVRIPAMGPHAAGATPPNLFPVIAAVDVIITGSATPTYGVNNP